MGKFRKKPVEIEAVEYRGQIDGVPSFMEHPAWLMEAVAKEPGEEGAVYPFGSDLVIGTLEGDHTARKGDWIIRGVAGEIYPCKPAIFTATYEPA